MFSQIPTPKDEIVQSLSDLHQLIEQHQGWGMDFLNFEHKVCNYEKDGRQYIGFLVWGTPGVKIRDQYELVQYLHKHYLPR